MGAGLIIGCSDTQTQTSAAGLSGAYDLAIVGNYVFVTSSDRNELRVLDLEADPRRFVPAPNPLEPLSIPVLERPTYLTRDVDYPQSGDTAGQEVTGPYVYARSDGSQAISVVAASPDYFKELVQLKNLGFVTAFAARGPGSGFAQSILYYATQEGADASLYRQELPSPEALARGDAVPAREELRMPGSTELDLTGETVAALLVLPSQSAGQEMIVVATRGTRGAPGRTFRLDLTARNNPTLVPYNFGAPVRLLATHPVVPETLYGDIKDNQKPVEQDSDEVEKACGIDTYMAPVDPNNPTGPQTKYVAQPQRRKLRAGEYVFGVLDESSCAGATTCSGVLAVDSTTGMVPLDATGFPMIPIRAGQGLATGLTLVQGANLNTYCVEGKVEQLPRPLVGVVPSSDGTISLFDAVKLRPFDFNTSGPTVPNRSVVDALGQNKTLLQSPESYISVELRNGAAQSDTYRMVYQGPLPSPRRRTFSKETQCTGGVCTFEVGSAEEARFVLSGDFIVLEGEGERCELEVTKDESVPTQVKLMTGVPTGDCATRTRFSLRAGNPAAPFAVYSDSRGFEGRVAKGVPLVLTGDYLTHPAGFTNEQPAFRARITLTDVATPAERGDQYIASVLGGVQSYAFAPDTGSLSAGLSSYRLPGPVSHTRVGGATLAYIAYPSADGILQVSLSSVTNNGVQSAGLLPFE
jgi:hypothetical protein